MSSIVAHWRVATFLATLTLIVFGVGTHKVLNTASTLPLKTQYPWWECSSDALAEGKIYNNLPASAQEVIERKREILIERKRKVADRFGENYARVYGQKTYGQIADCAWCEIPPLTQWRCFEMTPEKEAEVMCQRYGQCAQRQMENAKDP